MIDPDTALNLVIEHATPRPARCLPVIEATGCVLAEPVVADRDYPPFARAMMDGLAVRLEDAGFDWKVLGPDYDTNWLDYVAWQCDEDAYNAAGQKCSAQSVLFVHENWAARVLTTKKMATITHP